MSQCNLEIWNVCFYKEKNSFCKLKLQGHHEKPNGHLSRSGDAFLQQPWPSLQYSAFWRQSLNQTVLSRVLQHVNVKSSSRTHGRKWHRKSGSNWATVLKDPEWTTRGQSTRTSGSSWDISLKPLKRCQSGPPARAAVVSSIAAICSKGSGATQTRWLGIWLNCSKL